MDKFDSEKKFQEKRGQFLEYLKEDIVSTVELAITIPDAEMIIADIFQEVRSIRRSILKNRIQNKGGEKKFYSKIDE